VYKKIPADSRRSETADFRRKIQIAICEICGKKNPAPGCYRDRRSKTADFRRKKIKNQSAKMRETGKDYIELDQ